MPTQRERITEIIRRKDVAGDVLDSLLDFHRLSGSHLTGTKTFEHCDKEAMKNLVERALPFLLKSSSEGDSKAMANLGLLYLEGIEVKQDKKKALELFTQASELSDAWGQTHLAEMYFTSCEVEKDDHKARHLLQLASESGNPVAQFKLGILPWDFIDETPEESTRFIAMSAEQKYPPALEQLAWCYKTGCGVCQDPKKSFGYHLEAAKCGNALSQFTVAEMYETGTVVKKDKIKAVDWLIMAGTIAHHF